MDPIQGFRRSIAMATLGLGLAVAASPATAFADDRGSPTTDSPHPKEKRAEPAGGRRTPRATAAKPVAPARPAGPPSFTNVPTVHLPVAPAAAAVTPRSTRTVPHRIAVAPIVAPIVAPAAAATTAISQPPTMTPAGNAAAAAFDPFEALTSTLAMIGLEINRLFFNRGPTARPVQYSVSTGTIGGSDPEDDPLAYAVTEAPSHGSVVVDDAGTYTYTPGADLASTGGVDNFAVTLRDTGFHLNFWTPTSITVPVSVTIPAPAPTAPALSVGSLAVAEGDGTAAHFMFAARLSKASAVPVTVDYATSDGTASAGADYLAASGTLRFEPGITTQTVHVEIIGDTVDEPDETFTLTLSKPSGASIGAGAAVGTIIDDDQPGSPTPGISISDASATEPAAGTMAPGFLHTSGNQIVDSTGNPVQISGVNWFGLESSTGAPHGLWARSYKDMIDQMAAAGFNTIRLPFASETLHSAAAPNGIDFSKNPDLQGLTSIQVMDAVIAYAGTQGMRVILDHHRSGYGSGTSGNGLWYDAQYTEDAWVQDWTALAARYADNPTVIGMDLHNEPYNGSWGGGGADDWARAAERAGDAVLAVNPDLLVFVEGVGTYQGQSYWWGGNLLGVKDRPIVLNVPDRVVYSPHDYPNSVYPQPWFQSSDFGAALPGTFREMWGYLYQDHTAPVYLGEFGTGLQDPKDTVWLEAITSYLSGDFDNNGTVDIPAGTEDLSWTFWSWNPNSGDTGGILADDWNTINQNKMAYLTPIEFGGTGTATATFTVALSSPSTGQTNVHYATAGDTATAGADFDTTSGTVTFAPGETRKTITVSVHGDGLAEGSETFAVMLSEPVGATLTDSMGTGTITDRPAGIQPTADGDYVDLMTYGMFHGSDHTGMDALEGGRTAITTEAVVAYNSLRRFAGLAPATIEDVGSWAFANSLTNNAQPWDNDLQGVGLYYAMQGAKVGWIADGAYDPQIVADIERTARLGSADDVMAMVATYGHDGFAQYLMDNGYETAFIDTLKMEPHYGGWMHDRANGRLVIEGSATAHDVNHLTVLSHDQTQPFMNDTWDWPQWPALDVSDNRVIEYFQSMVELGDPKGRNLSALDRPDDPTIV